MKHLNDDPSDKELVLHIQGFPDDERRVLELLYRRHRPFALNVARRGLVSFRFDSDYSRDIVHDAFLRLPEAIRRMKAPDCFKGYLSMIVRRATLGFCRRHCRCDFVDPSELDGVVAPGSGVLIDDMSPGELFEILEDILPDKEFRIFILYARDGLTYSEIAERQSIKEATVRWYVARARKTIRNFLFADD